ncbi:hypothetical protein L7F22_060776 [Adiantum nelumboides]|nr:hypothetical protein [Adiantum nelumboides]
MMHEAVHAFGKSRADQRLFYCGAATCTSTFWFLCLLLHFLPFSAESLSPDGLALLQVKSAITADPLQLLSDWDKDAIDPCSWTGVTCGKYTSRVISLNITGEAFCGSETLPATCTDGFCGAFQTCPSLLWQSPDLQCSSRGLFSPQLDALAICLRNGEVSKSVSAYDPQDRVPCRLLGVLSPAIGNLTYLQVLSIPFNGFSGKLPSEIGQLNSLQVVDLRGNSFTGRIPAEIGQLLRLRVLNLAFNSFEDEIPSELANCGFLNVLNLAGNLLSGKIPAFIGNFSALQSLWLSYNQLDGIIPEEIASSCSHLEHLHLEGNFLFGTIPPVLGNCTNLKSLMVSSNFLSAPIPPELGKLSMLEALDVSRNSLAGDIPSQLGNSTKLSLLVLTNLLNVETCINRTMVDPVDGYTSNDKGEYNYFSGALPSSITSLPLLKVLWAPRAGFLAGFPTQWSVCANLEALNLGQNSLSGSIPLELTKCRNLIYLDVSFNSLEGNIPPELPVSCMVVFNVTGNFLSGTVSPPANRSCPTAGLLSAYSYTSSLYMSATAQSRRVDTIFSYFTSLYHGSVASSLSVGLALQDLLVVHNLSQNNFTGVVPAPMLGAGFGSEKISYSFILTENQFHDSIPDYVFSACASVQEFALSLSHNFLDGVLPLQAMLKCKSLKHFEASSNLLSGSIPPAIQGLKSLVYLDLGTNRFGDSIPIELGELQSLEYLILSNNSLVGSIPKTLGSLKSLIGLDLSTNMLTGEIPKELANLHSLKYLLLNNNSLSGKIPDGLENITSLKGLDVAFNNLSGAVPRAKGTESSCDQASFVGNPFLEPCVASAPAPSSDGVYVPRPFAMSPNNTMARSKSQLTLWKIVAVVVGSIVFTTVLLLLLCVCIKQQCSGRPVGQREVVLFVNTGVHLTYDNIVRSTGNFSVDNLIGNGGFGATYKAEPAPGFVLAVKKLYLGRVQGNQQFVAEIRTLGRIRHAHLVTLLGYYTHESEMFLIYNYLPGGNLESLLHNRDRGRIPWKVRHKIALNVAQALDYLHNGCHPRVLHRDIKPSNILLDTSLDAYLSDFGLARLLGASETHATTDVAGTFGYVAPEYALTGRVSDKADVYSYGVVLLELLSGKKALDPSFSGHGDGFNIVAWASHLYKRGQYETVFAPGLWEQGPHSELVDTLKVAIDCTEEVLAERPTMKQVVDCLKVCRLTSSF